jgi:hypothetical protein
MTKTPLTEYEKFKLFLIQNNLDIELAEPARLAPSILSYPWDKLIILLTMLGKDFKNKSTTILVKPIIYNAVRFQAAQENMFVTEYINKLFYEQCSSTVEKEIEYKIKHLAMKMEAFNDS